jgi:hypothetical protein
VAAAQRPGRRFSICGWSTGSSGRKLGRFMFACRRKGPTMATGQGLRCKSSTTIIPSIHRTPAVPVLRGSVYKIVRPIPRVSRPAASGTRWRSNCQGPDYRVGRTTSAVVVDAKGADIEELLARCQEGFLGLQEPQRGGVVSPPCGSARRSRSVGILGAGR